MMTVSSLSTLILPANDRRLVWLKRIGLTVALMLILNLMISFQHELDRRLDHSRIQVERLAQLPSGEYLKPAMLGYHHLGADALWLQFVQVLGKKRNTADEFEWMYHALDVMTTLDPQYAYVYYAGGVVLTSVGERPDLSTKLLEKGFRENPTAWNIPFLLGFNYYFHHHDPAMAAGRLAAAALLPGGPAYLPGLATRMYAEASNPEVALEFLEALWRQTSDPGMRKELEKRAKEVVIERDLKVLEIAVERYRSKEGRFPHVLQDLVKDGYLASLPDEPFGGFYAFDAESGKVASSTHPERLRVLHPEKKSSE